MTNYLIADGNNIVTRVWKAAEHFHVEPPDPEETARTALRSILNHAEAVGIPQGRCVVAFDGGAGAFGWRLKMYPAYKIERSARPENLKATLVAATDAISRAGLRAMMVPDEEADDLIATVARGLVARGDAVLVYSSDGDLLQLVGDRCMVVQPMTKGRHREWTMHTFGAAFPFAPSRFVEYRALRGDSSDSVPGVPGCGDVWAKRLVAGYPSLGAMYDQLRAMTVEPSKLQRSLLDHEDRVHLNHTLATLRDVTGITERHLPR